MTEGEVTLCHFLDDYLSLNWEIYVQPYLNGNRPDIVLLNPDIGIMVYEVKDWSLKTYKIKMKTGVDEAKNHVNQVEYYKKKIIEQLVPDMGETMDDNDLSFSLVQTGIYLHKITGKDANELFHNRHYPTIIGFDQLEISNLHKIVPYYNLQKSRFMTEKWAKDIRFWLKPPIHSKEQALPLDLSPKQKNYAKLDKKTGHRRLRGIAGSGKTLVLAYKAALLAEQRQKVLVITFNITLWHYIRDMIKRTPVEFDWSFITFKHFHGFCKDVLIELGVPLPSGRGKTVDQYLNELFTTVSHAIDKKGIPEILRFDAILIDEGQDYEWVWYDLLDKFLSERDELLFVCDKKQNIYGRELSWIDNMGQYKGKVKFRGEWRELNTVYRIPKNIGDVANKFSDCFNLEQSIEITEDYQQSTLYERPPIFDWENIQQQNWLDHIMEAYETIKYQQMNLGEGHASDIVILTPTRKIGIAAVEAFNKQNIEVNHVFERKDQIKHHRHKKAFWLGDSRLKISTIHSFKGWEAIHVILLIPEKWIGDKNLDSIVYTAMTRSRKNLIVLNSHDRYWEFGESLNMGESLAKDDIETANKLDENEIENWAETLPYPLASILWANLTSLSYEHKVKYLLHFFEAFSKFNFNLMLSGLSVDPLTYEKDVVRCFEDGNTKYSEWWFNEPSFGSWNYYGSSLSSIIRNQLTDKYQRNQCFKQFGKPKNDLLVKISDYDLYRTLKKAAKYRNVWEAHGPRVSEDEYEKRHEKLMSLLYNLQNIIFNAFEDNLLIIPVQSSLENGNYYNTVKKFMGTNERFRPMQIETSYPLDKSRIYMVTKNKRKPLELLPLIRVKDEVCYFYNGKNQHNGLSRYVSYYNEAKAEISLPEDEKLVGLLKYNG